MSAARSGSATPDDVIAYWYAGSPEERTQRWWRKDPATDADIAARFAADLRAAAAGERDAWLADARGRLAVILILDQFSRVIHRDTPAAWAQDTRAQRVVLDGLECGHHRELAPLERAFFYMPLMHAEDRALQARAAGCFDDLVRDAPPEARESCEGFARSAAAHRRIVDRFGRFPHRNHILGRPSNPEEEAFLKEPGSSF